MFRLCSFPSRAALFAPLAAVLLVVPTAAHADSDVRFQLQANPKTLACFAKDPDDKDHQPVADVRVEPGELNDTLHLHVRNLKPHLAFDLFTVQRSLLGADGKIDPNFKGSFGLAWYQTDVQANDDGEADVTIRTILLNQIFGFDPDVSLSPLNTFHVGFWFNNPADAAQCDPNPAQPIVTPFNGEHHAGPLAMISVPDAATNLGPLCTHPDTSTNPATCNP
ncbi:MAG: hypothetical protein JO023_06465 [Chloroflexi bacterium]|nr:hypothetical protein [Chloroflexota bacterium]